VPTVPVGATLVIALLLANAMRNPGDHKGRPYSVACGFSVALKACYFFCEPICSSQREKA
jgi:hypothetical protein